jgi:hypothetical protein
MSLLEELKQYRESRSPVARGQEHVTYRDEGAYELNEENEENLSPRPLTNQDINDDPVACRGCAEVIPTGTTLCAKCGSAGSPLVQYALKLSELTRQRTLRGRALVALDRRGYPKLRLSNGRGAGPGLLSWCPILQEADASMLKDIIEAARPPRRKPRA